MNRIERDCYYVIAPDYPAFGHSDTPDRKTFAYTFDNFAEIGKFLDRNLLSNRSRAEVTPLR